MAGKRHARRDESLLAFAAAGLPHNEDRSPFVDKVGGLPVFVANPGVEQPECALCKQPLYLVCQTVAPNSGGSSVEIDTTAATRAVLSKAKIFYLFGCNNRKCSSRPESWKVIRCSYGRDMMRPVAREHVADSVDIGDSFKEGANSAARMQTPPLSKEQTPERKTQTLAATSVPALQKAKPAKKSAFGEFADSMISDDMAEQFKFSGIFGRAPDEVPLNLENVMDAASNSQNIPIDLESWVEDREMEKLRQKEAEENAKLKQTSQSKSLFGSSSKGFSFGADLESFGTTGAEDMLSFGDSPAFGAPVEFGASSAAKSSTGFGFGSASSKKPQKSDTNDVEDLVNMIDNRNKTFKWKTGLDSDEDEEEEEEVQDVNTKKDIPKQDARVNSLAKEFGEKLDLSDESQLKTYVMPMAKGSVFPSHYVEFDEEGNVVDEDEYLSSGDEATGAIYPPGTEESNDFDDDDDDEDDIKEENLDPERLGKYTKKYDHEMKLLQDYITVNKGLGFDVDTKAAAFIDVETGDNKDDFAVAGKNKGKGKKKPTKAAESDDDDVQFGSNNKYDPEAYESTKIQGIDREFVRFQSHVRAEPEQLIRYNRQGRPLVLKEEEQNRLSKSVSKCPHCGSRKVFEFQTMPCILSVLSVGQHIRNADGSRVQLKKSQMAASQNGRARFEALLDKHARGMDFASVVVYSCSRNCTPLAKQGKDKNLPLVYVEESVDVIVD